VLNRTEKQTSIKNNNTDRVESNQRFLKSQSGSQGVEPIFSAAVPTCVLLQSVGPLFSPSHTDCEGGSLAKGLDSVAGQFEQNVSRFYP